MPDIDDFDLDDDDIFHGSDFDPDGGDEWEEDDDDWVPLEEDE